MAGWHFIKQVAISLSVMSCAVSPVNTFAQSRQTSKAASPSQMKAALPDIALSSRGTLSGRVVDQSGAPINGTQVSVRQGTREIGRTVTDSNGQYSLSNLRGGIYTVASGNTEGLFRVWIEGTAPPVAKEQALLVLGQNGERGQAGAIATSAIIALGTTAGIVPAAVIAGMKSDSPQPATASTPAISTPALLINSDPIPAVDFNRVPQSP